MDAQKTTDRDDIVFALDIGTRSIVGVLGSIEDDMFSVFDHEQRFHRKRAMRDGQIEDVNLVAKTVAEVKEALETRNNLKLESVSVAAAGRALKTARHTFEQTLNEEENITSELIHSMEYNAISLAMDSFSLDGQPDDSQGDAPDTASDSPRDDAPTSVSADNYSCVGYNVVQYLLDGYPLANPLEQRGRVLGVELIAAFLPFSVVRSLYSVTELCGLSVRSLTLEPIAAINAVVPPDVRLLNIAITDIGAGTSDIGIAKNGSIVAYDMVTIAGDEITERIMKEYLMDFDTAEKVKRQLSENIAEVSFSDILGLSHTCSVQSILDTIDPIVELLSQSIADTIVRINDGPPTALFLVGGGSQIPNLCRKTAERLDMPEQRVALGGKHPYKSISLHTPALLTPEFVTPLGIGATSRLTHIHDLFSVTVNDSKITLPGAANVKVLDALLLAGIKASNLIGRYMAPLVYYLNNEKFSARGPAPVPGEIRVNKKPAALDTLIRQGDTIEVNFARHGGKPLIRLESVREAFGPTAAITVNDKVKPMEYEIQNGDRIEILENGKRVKIFDHNIRGENFDEEETPATPRKGGKTASAPGQAKKSVPTHTVRVRVNADWMDIPVFEDKALIFVDMLNYVDIDTKRPDGELILSVNNRAASYTDPIMDGDSVEIRWSNQ